MDSTDKIYQILFDLNKVGDNKDFPTSEEMNGYIKLFDGDATIASRYVMMLHSEGYIQQLRNISKDITYYRITIKGLKYLIEIEDKKRTERLYRLQAAGAIAAAVIASLAFIYSVSSNSNSSDRNNHYYNYRNHSFRFFR